MNEISGDLLSKIKQDGQVDLSILSVYSDVINLVDADQRIISLLNQGKKLAPMSIRLGNPAEFEALKNHSRLTLDFSGASAIELRRGIEVTDLYLYPQPMRRDTILSAQRGIMDFLRANAPTDSFYPVIRRLLIGEASGGNSSFDDQAREYILVKLRAYLRPLVQTGGLDAKINFLGVGKGLTPSSDDFMLGLSAVFQYEGDPRLLAVKRHGERCLGTTTVISAQMLNNAWAGYYSAQLHALFRAMGEASLLAAALWDMLDYGHTSGADTLCGIAMGIELAKPDSVIFWNA